MNNIQKINEATARTLASLNKIEENQKLSDYLRGKLNEAGLSEKRTKLEDVAGRVYSIAMHEEDSEKAIKAIKLIFETIGGGLNEKSVPQTNVQNNFNFGDLLKEIKNKENT